MENESVSGVRNFNLILTNPDALAWNFDHVTQIQKPKNFQGLMTIVGRDSCDPMELRWRKRKRKSRQTSRTTGMNESKRHKRQSRSKVETGMDGLLHGKETIVVGPS